MSLTLEQVRRVAHLARIEVSDAEAETTLGHLNGIFTLIETMQAVDTQGVEPMAHAQDLSQRLREDLAAEHASRREVTVLAAEDVMLDRLEIEQREEILNDAHA